VNTYAWMGLAVLAVGVVLFLVLLLVQLRRRNDPEQQGRLPADHEQETLNLARRMWMSGGE
jgi:hypothetical protein